MATYYVNSGALGTDTGGSWTDAFLTFGQAVTAATLNGDVIKVHYTHQESLAVDTTYTLTANVTVLSVNKDSADALTEMGANGFIGHASLNRQIVLGGAVAAYLWGVHLLVSGGAGDSLSLGTQASSLVFEKCRLANLNTTNSSANRIKIGNTNDQSAFGHFKECVFAFGNTTWSQIEIRGRAVFDGCSVDSANAVPAVLFSGAGADPGGFIVECNGCDWSHVSSYLMEASSSQAGRMVMTNCKLNASVTPLLRANAATYSRAPADLWLLNCASGDTHYGFAHYDQLGDTTVSAAIYANDGALYDGTNHVTWKITTTADASFYNPYVSPWIDKYHSGLTAITPSLQILRDGSAVAYKDDEVWGEWSYQGNLNTTQSMLVNDRRALTGVAADQPAGVGLAGWTGESASAWSGKLQPGASITPAELGHLRARICVGAPSSTVYVDPTIR